MKFQKSSIETSKTFCLNFLGIGFARSGTTWLNESLKAHPQIGMPKERELNYFCTDPLWSTVSNQEKDLNWLKKRFDHCKHMDIKGEFNTIYIMDPSAPILIKAYPDIKLIISYREPADRLLSMYYMLKRLYSIPDSFEKFLEKEPKYIETGYYYTLTKRFLKHFDRQKFHYIIFDDIIDNPAKVLSDLYKFLGVTSDFVPSFLNERVNSGKVPASKFLRDTMGNSSEYLKSRSWGRKLHSLLASFGIHEIARKISDLNVASISLPPMREETRHFLKEIYTDEVSNLQGLIKRDLIGWGYEI